jgi:transposase
MNGAKMNGSNVNPPQTDYAAYVAIDWADQKHTFSLLESGQRKKESGVIEQKPQLIGAWMAKLRERFSGRLIAIAVEQSRGALISALLSYDFVVIYPLHPTTVAKFREAFKSSGAKSDPLDTDQILEILTKHLELLKPLNPDTEETRRLARLAQDRRKLVYQRTSQIEALSASLKEYFPQAIELLSGNLASRLACDFLKRWPDFEAFQQAKPSTIKRFFYGHNIRSPKVLARVLEVAQRGCPLSTDRALVESGGRLTQAHAQLIATLNPIIEQYDQRIEALFNEHPEAYLYQKLPGAGPALAPRLLAFFGTDRSRYEGAVNVQSFCGVAPVTKSSGKTKSIYMRRACPKFDRQTFHEFARLSVFRSQWARNYLDYYIGKGKKFNTVVRALAFKWIRILFRCWQDRKPYEEAKHMANLLKRGSIFATLHLKKS